MPIIQVNLMEGRSDAQKRRLALGITDATVEALGVDRQSVRVMFHELTPNHYAVAGVTASESPLSARPGRRTDSGNGHLPTSIRENGDLIK